MRVEKYKQFIFPILVIVMIIYMITIPGVTKDKQLYDQSTFSYEKARVVKILEEELTDSYLSTGQKLGYQKILAELKDGQQIEIENFLTDEHNVLLKQGMKFILSIDAPENAEPYYTVYNYSRTPALLALVIVFFVLMIAVGRKKGFYSGIAIFFTLIMILKVIVPKIYCGASPVLMSAAVVCSSTFVTLALLQGFAKQSFLSMAVTLCGEIIAILLFGIFSKLLSINGLHTEDAEGLLLISQRTGLKIAPLLMAGTMISALGAVMDVSVSMISAMKEIADTSKINSAKLFRSGMNIGKDMIGTMSNTLIFAFTGGAIMTILVLYSYGIPLNQLLNSNYLCIEIAQGLCSTGAVVATVPIAAAVGATFYANSK